MSISQRRNLKLSTKCYGPYKVSQRIGKVASKIQLPPSARIHNVFYVSQLKKKIGESKTVQKDLPQVTGEGEMKPVLVAILDTRLVKKGQSPATMVLVRWSHTVSEVLLGGVE